MDLEKELKEKDKFIEQLIERLDRCQRRLEYIQDVKLKVQKVLKKCDDGNFEALMITNIHNTPDGVIVEVT